MFIRGIKLSVYSLLIFFVIQGVLSIKSQMSKDKYKEEFSEENTTESEEDTITPAKPPETKPPATKPPATKSPTNTPSALITGEGYDTLVKDIHSSFDVLKKTIDRQMDNTKKLVNDSVNQICKIQKEPVIESEVNESDVIESEDDTDSQLEDDVSEYDEEEDTFFSEGFVEDGMYDGITSPYCLNCSSI